jgi:exopolysaccharide biosynthesis WecB/TagA/CpsF family protein
MRSHDMESPRLSKTIYLYLKSIGDFIAGIGFFLVSMPVCIISKSQASRLQRGARRLLNGERTLIGPSKPQSKDGRVFLRKGIISDARLCRMMNLEFSREELDNLYCQQVNPKKDLALLIRGIWVFLISGEPGNTPLTQYFNLFDVVVNNSELDRVIDTIKKMIESHPNCINQMLAQVEENRHDDQYFPPAHTCFVNANNFNLAVEKPKYLQALRHAELVLPDGIGVKIALRMAGGHLRKNLNGTDLLPFLIELLISNSWPLYLLGADSQTLKKAISNLQSQYPDLNICGSHDGFFKEENEEALCKDIVDTGTFVLIVGMGTPRQELWVERNQNRLPIPMVLTMGGLIDFIGEKNKRAPGWMRQAGLEWIFRILQEPRRMWKRYIIGNPVFLWRTRQWIKKYKKKQNRKKVRMD